MDSIRQTLLIVRKPPFGSVDSWEAMRLALSFYGSHAQVAVVFEGDGVSNWVSQMMPETASAYSVARFVRDLEQFGIPVYVVSEDLAERGLNAHDMASSHARLIPRAELARMVSSYDNVAAI